MRSQDLQVLLLMLVVVLGVWGFVALADEVTEGDTRTFDEWLIRALRGSERPLWLDSGMRDLTALGSVAVLTLVTAGVAGFLAIRRQSHALGLLGAALVGGLLFNATLKGYFARPRPDLIPHLAHVTSPSFPSGHSLLSTVVYLTLGALLARLVKERHLKIYVVGLALLLAFLVGVSRIYLGVHYPTDVLAGWTIGLIWAIACWLVARHLQQRGAVEKPK